MLKESEVFSHPHVMQEREIELKKEMLNELRQSTTKLGKEIEYLQVRLSGLSVVLGTRLVEDLCCS